mmetsp:Transcript_29326/g.93857  ORF Transcript_29326/g.93857 Transcript_29326/m.93857 type:complete len:330 (-) Transcript_29326:711-1700(-)
MASFQLRIATAMQRCIQRRVKFISRCRFGSAFRVFSTAPAVMRSAWRLRAAMVELLPLASPPGSSSSKPAGTMGLSPEVMMGEFTPMAEAGEKSPCPRESCAGAVKGPWDMPPVSTSTVSSFGVESSLAPPPFPSTKEMLVRPSPLLLPLPYSGFRIARSVLPSLSARLSWRCMLRVPPRAPSSGLVLERADSNGLAGRYPKSCLLSGGVCWRFQKGVFFFRALRIACTDSSWSGAPRFSLCLMALSFWTSSLIAVLRVPVIVPTIVLKCAQTTQRHILTQIPSPTVALQSGDLGGDSAGAARLTARAKTVVRHATYQHASPRFDSTED